MGKKKKKRVTEEGIEKKWEGVNDVGERGDAK